MLRFVGINHQMDDMGHDFGHLNCDHSETFEPEADQAIDSIKACQWYIPLTVFSSTLKMIVTQQQEWHRLQLTMAAHERCS